MTKRYSIRVCERIAGNLWQVEYYVWEGCSCNKVLKKATLESERRPSQSMVMEYDAITAN